MNHKVVDNFLSDPVFNILNNYLNDEYTPWFYKNGTTDISEGENISWFLHTFYVHNKPNDPRFENLFNPILNKLKVRSLLRINCNLILKGESHKIKYSNWHTDFDYSDSKTAILYMNTNNGKTILKYNDEEYPIDSVKNRVVIFPSNTLHRVQLHNDIEKRIVVNINYF